MSKQKKDLPNRFVQQLVRHGGSYTDVFSWDRVGSIYGGNDDITFSSQHQSDLVTLKEYVIVCNK